MENRASLRKLRQQNNRHAEEKKGFSKNVWHVLDRKAFERRSFELYTVYLHILHICVAIGPGNMTNQSVAFPWKRFSGELQHQRSSAPYGAVETQNT